MTGDGPGEGPVTARLRRGLLGLAALGIAGTAAELAAIRHWNELSQLIPWAALALMAGAVGAVAVRPTGRRVRLAQAFGVLSIGGGLFGVYDHVAANYHAAPLDAVFGARWETMGFASRWWAAATGDVGPAPILAPAILVQISFCLFLATLAHPATRRPGPGRP